MLSKVHPLRRASIETVHLCLFSAHRPRPPHSASTRMFTYRPYGTLGRSLTLCLRTSPTRSMRMRTSSPKMTLTSRLTPTAPATVPRRSPSSRCLPRYVHDAIALRVCADGGDWRRAGYRCGSGVPDGARRALARRLSAAQPRVVRARMDARAGHEARERE